MRKQSSFYHAAICILLLLQLTACSLLTSSGDGATRNSPQPTLPNLEGTSWTLFAFRKSRPIEGTHFTLAFEGDQVRGNAGCNSYFGRFQIEGDQISFSELGMTEMACLEPEGLMEQEQYLFAFLGDGERFELTDVQLFIFRSDGEALSFDRMD